MSNKITASIQEHFGDLEDPRCTYLNDHPLLNIITIALCAIIAGADNWTEVELFGEQKLNWLSRFLDMSKGVPSHDTFGRVFARLNPIAFQKSFLSWVQAVFEVTDGQIIALDGKKLNGSHDQVLGKKAINMVSAWATSNHLVLGQVKVDDKSNEITALPQLLELLELQGCIVTIDAMGTQIEIAQQIINQGGEYLLPVKENQKQLLEDITLFFNLAHQKEFRQVHHTYHRTADARHGRLEIRQCWAVSGIENLNFLRTYDCWPKLNAIAMIRSERRFPHKVEQSTQYFITSTPNDAQTILHIKRAHWGIENQLHWVLDVAFREDDSRIRTGYADQNIAVLRHMALNLLKQENSVKKGLKAKRLKAALNEDYLFKVLTG
jgi:predicted transposase YbfD/YdcC